MKHRILIALVAILVAVDAASAQSLWDGRRTYAPIGSDTTARMPGDILTVVISENQRIRNKEETEFTKDLGLDAALTNFDILPNMFNPLPSAAGTSSRSFDGEGKYDKQGTFESMISVMVIDVLPNGNLIIEGRRRVIMDRETKTIRMTGIVRPFDVLTDNTVRSEKVANASIAYEGQGPLTTTTNRGWLSDLLDFVWPF